MLLLAALTLGCSEYTVREPPKVPPAQPPGREVDGLGSAPDWTSCYEGYWGHYSNFDVTHPDVFPDGLPVDDTAGDAVADTDPGDPHELDWWDDPTFTRFDASLEFGTNWWPVDEDREGDPALFAVRWNAWMRVYDRGEIEFVLGAADDAWVFWKGEQIAAQPGLHPFETERIRVSVDAGQAPIELYYAHRGSPESGFRFRVVEGDVKVCLPEYEDESADE